MSPTLSLAAALLKVTMHHYTRIWLERRMLSRRDGVCADSSLHYDMLAALPATFDSTACQQALYVLHDTCTCEWQIETRCWSWIY